MLTLRRSDERGHFDFGWLDTWHSFSFGEYYDPRFMGLSHLRVINEDRVQPGHGFPPHPHRDMEIISYVLEGALEHKDSMGNGSVIRPGEVQKMSAGTGVVHSEYNPSQTEPVHFLQIWITPGRSGIQPEYAQARFDPPRAGEWQLLASPTGESGSILLYQDAWLYRAHSPTQLKIAPGRQGWMQVTRGAVRCDGQLLNAGDGAAVSGDTIASIVTQGPQPSEVLLFDLV